MISVHSASHRGDKCLRNPIDRRGEGTIGLAGDVRLALPDLDSAMLRPERQKQRRPEDSSAGLLGYARSCSARAVGLAAHLVGHEGDQAAGERDHFRSRVPRGLQIPIDRLRHDAQGALVPGGDASVVDDYGRFARAARREPIVAPQKGFVEAIDAESIGRASMMLGAGRERLDTAIDYGAGIQIEAPVGTRVSKGDVLAWLAVGSTARFDDARSLAAGAFVVGDAAPSPLPLVIDVVS